MMTYLKMRDAAVKIIGDKLSKVKPKVFVSSHAGKFTEDDIRRCVQRSPSVLTTIMKIADAGDGTDNSECYMTSWVLYRADNRDRLYDGGLLLVSMLIPILKSIDVEGSYEVSDIDAENLFTGTLDKINVTLWAVSWKWKVRAAVLPEGEILFDGELEMFRGADGALLSGEQETIERTEMEV